MDRLWAAGIPLRVAVHAGLNHQKLVMLYGQDMAVFGSSNWTTPSANQQQEHNYFATKPWIFQWFVDQFERKWNNLAPNGAIETGWFTPLPPDKPVTLAPADVAVGQSLSMALKWDGGPWGQLYDIYFGTDPNPPLFAANQQLGPTDPATPTATQKFVLPLLQHGTTYYWRVISKTMAGLTAKGPIISFTTSGTPPPPPPPSGATTIVMWTATDVAAGDVVGTWQWTADNTAAGGRALWNPDRGQSKVSPPLAAPANYFETTFDAAAGAYRVWLRMRAQGNSTSNNSVSVQFNDALDQYGSPLYRIGSAQGAELVLQDPSGTLSGWGWDDNSVNGQPTLVYFAAAGQHRLRIQQRSDGAIVDQIVLSPDAFISSAPGGTRNDATIYGSTIDGAAPPPPSAPPPPPPSLALPSPWTHQDIGNTVLKGYAEFDGSTSTFSVAGTGADVWGTADALHFAYVPLTGDGTIVARVASVQNTNVWAKAGVMIRETASPGSADAFMVISPARGTAFQRRKVTGAPTSSTTGSNAVPPYWVRLDRAGNTFSAYQSADGAIWRLVGTDTIPMAAGVLIGLGNSSHTTDSSSLAAFDRVSVNGVPVGGTPSCQYTISPVSQDVAADGAAVGVNVTTADSCAWTAASNASWMTVTGGSSGSGNGSVTIGVSANTGAARTGTVTIAGQPFTVSQAAAPSPCSYAISPTTQAMVAGGGTAAVTVTTDGSCSWTAVANAPWIAVTAGASGTGNGTVSMNVANGGSSPGLLIMNTLSSGS
jgi:regulation of enolase protein 1 (concanavalin A-like superfamily)